MNLFFFFYKFRRLEFNEEARATRTRSSEKNIRDS